MKGNKNLQNIEMKIIHSGSGNVRKWNVKGKILMKLYKQKKRDEPLKYFMRYFLILKQRSYRNPKYQL